MAEPPIPVQPCPFNGTGWPMACIRVELTLAEPVLQTMGRGG